MIHKRGEQCYQCEGNGKRDSIPWGSTWDSCSDVRQSRGTRNSATQQKITGISKLNNFRFYPGGMRVWQVFDIGPANVFLWKEQMVNLTLYSLCSV